MTIDLESIRREDPYIPERLLEASLHQLEQDVARVREEKRGVLSDGRRALESVLVARDSIKRASEMTERVIDEQLKELAVLFDPDSELEDAEAAAGRFDRLEEQSKEMRAAAITLADKHMAHSRTVGELAVQLQRFIDIVPRVRRDVRIARGISSITRALSALIAFGLAVVFHVAFGLKISQLLGGIAPPFSEYALAAAIYLLVVFGIERPKDHLVATISWYQFDHTRRLRAKHLESIACVENQLKDLVAEA